MALAHQSFKVGIAQINIELANLEKNIDKHITFIKEAKKKSINLLIFPELSLSGYFINERINDVAMFLDSEVINIIKNESQGLRVIFGFPQERRNFLVCNSAICVYNEIIEFVHNKINLPNYNHLSERSIFTPSNELNCFEIDKYWKYAILICADLWNPYLVHQSMLEEANVLIVPFNSGERGDISYKNGWQTTFDFYSMMYGCYILGANRVGVENGFKFFGNSVIMNPFGK